MPPQRFPSDMALARAREARAGETWGRHPRLFQRYRTGHRLTPSGPPQRQPQNTEGVSLQFPATPTPGNAFVVNDRLDLEPPHESFQRRVCQPYGLRYFPELATWAAKGRVPRTQVRRVAGNHGRRPERMLENDRRPLGFLRQVPGTARGQQQATKNPS